MTDDLWQWARRYDVSARAVTELLDIIDPSRETIASGATSEAAVQSSCRLVAPKYGAALWRNNNGAMEDTKTGRHIRFGLGNDSKRLCDKWKSSDLIGITPAVSTQAGQTFGVFTAVEIKTPGWCAPKNDRERAQAAFLSTVRAMGGIGMFAQSTEDYERIFST